MKLVIQNGHTHKVAALAISPTGKYIATGSADKTVKLWTVDGKLLKTFYSTSNIENLTFSKDGKYLAFAFDHIVLIELENLRQYTIHFSENTAQLSSKHHTVNQKIPASIVGHSISFSPIDNTLAIACNDSVIRLLDPSNQSFVDAISTQYPSKVTSVKYLSDGKTWVSASKNASLVFYSNQGTVLKTFLGHSKQINDICFCNNTTDKTDKKGKTKTDAKLSIVYMVSCGSDKKLIVWDIDGNVIHQIHAESTIYSVDVSPNGNTIVYSVKDRIYIYDLVNKKIRYELSDQLGYYVYKVRFLKDAEYFVSTSGSSSVKIWSVSGVPIKSMENHSNRLNGLELLEQGFIVVDEKGYLTIWDTEYKVNAIHKDSFREEIKTISVYKNQIAISSGELNIYVLSNLGTVLYEIVQRSQIDIVLYSSNGMLYVISKDHSLRIYNILGELVACKFITTLEPSLSDIYEVNCFDNQFEMTAINCRYFNSTHKDDAIVILDGSLELLHRLSYPKHKPISVHFLSKNQLISVGADEDILSWKLGNGSQVIKEKNTDATFHVTSVELYCTKDSHGVFMGLSNGEIQLYWIEEPERIEITRSSSSKKSNYTFKGHLSKVTSMKIDYEKNFLYSCSKDSTIKIWNIQNGLMIATLFSFGEKEWFIYTEDGLFDCSRNAGEMVAVVDGLKAFGVDQFAVKNNRPDRILERLGCLDKNLIEHFKNQYTKRMRKLGFTEETVSKDILLPTLDILTQKVINNQFGNDRLLIQFEVKSYNFPVKSYNLYVNDVPIYPKGKFIDTIPQKTNSCLLEDSIELSMGENKVEISCWNEAGMESYRAITTVFYPKKKKYNLYFIGFGVSQYKNSSDILKNLLYAHKDVLDLYELFSGLTKHYASVFCHSFINDQVSKQSICDAKTLLEGASVDDLVVLFVAGHGIHIESDLSKELEFYYLTHYTDPNDIENTAANFEHIENILKGIKPRKKLMLLDTCESGEVDTEYILRNAQIEKARGLISRNSPSTSPEITSRTLRFIYNDLYRRSGAIVISSCKGGEVSYEHPKFENGLFTEAILEAFAGKADTNKDNLISTEELREYVFRRVSKWTKGLQNPTVDRDNLYQKFSIPCSLGT